MTTTRKKKPADTSAKLERMAADVARYAKRGEDPGFDIPTRSLSNAAFDEKKKIIMMGDAAQRRNFFNLGQAKKFMQTMLVASGCKELADQGKSTSIRDMFYHCKHTIKGTKENTFDDQSESDPIIEDLEVTIGSIREELGLFAENKGNMVGPMTIVDNGDTIDLSRMGSGGWGVPSIVEPNVIEFKKSDAKFVLLIEKSAVWNRFNQDRFWEKYNCAIIHGGGQPPRGVRRMVYRMHKELKLPVYVLADNDPWGYYIYSVLKQGSDQPRLREPTHGHPVGPLHRHERLRPRGVRLHERDRPQRQGHHPPQGNRRLPVVRQQKAVAKGDCRHAQERREDGTRDGQQQGLQLHHRGVHAGEAQEEAVVGLTGGRIALKRVASSMSDPTQTVTLVLSQQALDETLHEFKQGKWVSWNFPEYTIRLELDPTIEGNRTMHRHEGRRLETQLIMAHLLPDDRLPQDITQLINLSYREAVRSFEAGCNLAAISVCGRTIETALGAVYQDVVGVHPSQDKQKPGMNAIINRCNREGYTFPTGLKERMEMIAVHRNMAVHGNLVVPTEDEARSVIYATRDVLKIIAQKSQVAS